MVILFDVDDTLLKDSRATKEAAEHLRTRFATGLSADAFQRRWTSALDVHFDRYLAGEITFQDQRRERIRDALRLDVTDVVADGLFEVYLTAYEQSWCLFDDVVECLDALDTHQLGIISNGSSGQQRAKLARTGILERFAHVVVSEEVGVAKPDRLIFTRACELGGVTPSEAIYVGDRRDTDALGSSRAGLQAVWVNRFGRFSTPSAEFRTIRGLDEVPLIVGELCSRRRLTR